MSWQAVAVCGESRTHGGNGGDGETGRRYRALFLPTDTSHVNCASALIDSISLRLYLSWTIRSMCLRVNMTFSLEGDLLSRR
jgi:hypothetical protein